MAKRQKPPTKGPTSPLGASPTAPLAHPPARQPLLLGTSIVLFGLWFVFLLVAAIWNK
ncbi:MAG: hypothetical protein WD872_06535 [Pirellulaceae bacterium]